MKRYGDLMASILDYENLLIAFHKAAKGKADRKDVIQFRKNLTENLHTLRIKIDTDTMIFGTYSFFTVHDPKTRDICAAAFKERVAHHALMNVCGPILDQSQIFHSYACQKDKGQHGALSKARKWAACHDFYLKMDISKFFDSVDHAILKQMLYSRIKDKKVLVILFDIIESYNTAHGKGLPLGNLTSQYFANFYLTRFDHWIKQAKKARFYLRYMDDMLIVGDKSMLCQLRDDSRQYLNNDLKLHIKNGGQINRTDKGIGFLGSVIYPGVLKLSSSSKKRIRVRIKQYEKKYRSKTMDALDLQERTNALWAGLYHINSYGWRKNLARKCMDI
jgi:RNA-directed DNA polymerase